MWYLTVTGTTYFTYFTVYQVLYTNSRNKRSENVRTIRCDSSDFDSNGFQNQYQSTPYFPSTPHVFLSREIKWALLRATSSLRTAILCHWPSVGPISLQWRHNDHDGVSNHQPHGCSLNRLFRRRSKKTSKLRVTDLCVGNSPGPVNSPHKGPVTRKCFHLMTS